MVVSAGFVSDQGMWGVGAGDDGFGNGGFGHHSLMIVAVILSDCTDGYLIIWWRIVMREFDHM